MMLSPEAKMGHQDSKQVGFQTTNLLRAASRYATDRHKTSVGTARKIKKVI